MHEIGFSLNPIETTNIHSLVKAFVLGNLVRAIALMLTISIVSTRWRCCTANSRWQQQNKKTLQFKQALKTTENSSTSWHVLDINKNILNTIHSHSFALPLPHLFALPFPLWMYA